MGVTTLRIRWVRGNLAQVVRFRFGFGFRKRFRLSCCDDCFFVLCRGCGRLLDRLRLAIRGSPDGFDDLSHHLCTIAESRYFANSNPID